MTKPRVFIASSSEGLRVAETVFSNLNKETESTLWTHQIFTPGAYPLEALEEAMRRHSFAVLVASPDDELLKRGAIAPVMRDNLLLEFGLFTGALGRKRVFFICPDEPRLDLPSDLFGVGTSTYEASRAKGSSSDRAAAVQAACQQIRDVIREQWEMLQRQERERSVRIRASKESQAIQRLYTVSTRLRDVLITSQRGAFAAFTDRTAFDQLKNGTVDEVNRILDSFDDDVRTIGVHTEIGALHLATRNALLDLPFPEELSDGQAAINVGLGALNTLMRGGGGPLAHVQQSAQGKAGGGLASLTVRYGEWWDRHSPLLQSAMSGMQDALFAAMVRVASEQQDSSSSG